MVVLRNFLASQRDYLGSSQRGKAITHRTIMPPLADLHPGQTPSSMQVAREERERSQVSVMEACPCGAMAVPRALPLLLLHLVPELQHGSG